jgi:AhpD family alkylhydroperoxidase
MCNACAVAVEAVRSRPRNMGITPMNIDSLGRAIEAGTVSARDQKLVVLGIALALRGDDCVANHVRDALEAGASRAELADAVKVALTIGSDAALKYERRLYRALERLDERDAADAASGHSHHTSHHT